LLTDTAKLCITPKYLTIKAIDGATVAMINIKIGKAVFKKYNATNFELGLNLDRIKKIIDLGNADELIDIKFIQENNQLGVSIGEFKTLMGIVDFSEFPIFKPGSMNATGKVTLKVDKLKRSIIYSDDISDVVVLGIDRNKFELRAEENVNAVKLRLKKTDLEKLQSSVYYQNLYSSKYLKNLFQCLEDESFVEMCFGDETPLQIVYDFPYSGSSMTYFLCPRVKESC
jgi:proliferating cell nuclear antigen